jgi:transposase
MVKTSTQIQPENSTAEPNMAYSTPTSTPSSKSAPKTKLVNRISEFREEIKRLASSILFLCQIFMVQLKEKDRTIEEISNLLRSKDAEIKKLKEELAASKKNSSNSSRKPSSDDVTKPKKKRKTNGKGKPGAPNGHEAHHRPKPKPSEVDQTHEYEPESDTCDCGHALVRDEKNDTTHYQYEIVEKPVQLNAHVEHAHVCPNCGKIHKGAAPVEVEGAGLVGVRLLATIVDLRSQGVSISGIQSHLESAYQFHLSKGYISELLTQKASPALKEPYEELAAALPDEPKVGIDETGHKENGKRIWTWAFCTKTFVLFKIAAGRSADIIADIMKNYKGIITCDFFSAYRKFMKDNPDATVQFCLAHLIRDIKFLAEYHEAEVRSYGNKLLEIVKELFELHHKRFEDEPSPDLQGRLEECAERLRLAALDAPEHQKAQNLANRFRDYANSYLLFVKDVFVDPTNNATEQAIRFLVILRHVTQGTRSEDGRRFAERLWTVKGTCAKNDVSLYDYMVEALKAHYGKRPHPSLLDLSHLK